MFLHPYLNPPIPSHHPKPSPLWILSWNLDKGLSRPTLSVLQTSLCDELWTVEASGARRDLRGSAVWTPIHQISPEKPTTSITSIVRATAHQHTSHVSIPSTGLKPRASQITVRLSSCEEKDNITSLQKMWLSHIINLRKHITATTRSGSNRILDLQSVFLYSETLSTLTVFYLRVLSTSCINRII